MPSSHFILCHFLFLLPPIRSSINVFSNESTLRMRWPKYRSFSFSIIPSKEIPGLISFFSCLQSFPASGSFQKLALHIRWPSIGVSASASVLPMNIQDWFPLVLTAGISLQSKGFSRVFSNTTVQKYQFFGAQFSLWSNSQIHTWLLEKP